MPIAQPEGNPDWQHVAAEGDSAAYFESVFTHPDGVVTTLRRHSLDAPVDYRLDIFPDGPVRSISEQSDSFANTIIKDDQAHEFGSVFRMLVLSKYREDMEVPPSIRLTNIVADREHDTIGTDIKINAAGDTEKITVHFNPKANQYGRSQSDGTSAGDLAELLSICDYGGAEMLDATPPPEFVAKTTPAKYTRESRRLGKLVDKRLAAATDQLSVQFDPATLVEVRERIIAYALLTLDENSGDEDAIDLGIRMLNHGYFQSINNRADVTVDITIDFPGVHTYVIQESETHDELETITTTEGTEVSFDEHHISARVDPRTKKNNTCSTFGKRATI